ncbi:MAG: lipid-A-disaccharide synthase [Planctomycetes bacterium]|nr:lipid-A-disaccharide synthase [Planctomycetota bacterium]
MTTILIVAGEPSGDLHGARLARALVEADPAVRLLGAGGPKMKAAGVELRVETTRHAVTGIVEVLGGLSEFRRWHHRLVQTVQRDRPEAVVCIDFPDFNLRFAETAAALGTRLVYYICPQVWAWRKGRVRAIRRLFSRVLCIFPFEEAFYGKHGVPAKWVGHPLIDALAEAPPPADLRRELGIPAEAPLIACLPGSRTSEVRRHWPIFREAARRVAGAHPETRFVCAAAEDLPDEALAEGHGPRVEIARVRGRTRDVLHAATMAWVASGTATVEAALAGTPMIVVYRIHPATWAALLPLVKVPHIAMANLVANRRLVPELVQWNATPERLCRETERLWPESARAGMRRGLREVQDRLGKPGASARAALEILAVARE